MLSLLQGQQVQLGQNISKIEKDFEKVRLYYNYLNAKEYYPFVEELNYLIEKSITQA